jgi:hypothetical protein
MREPVAVDDVERAADLLIAPIDSMWRRHGADLGGGA